MLHFLHHHDRVNVGDVLSGPYHYFDLGAYEKLSWDVEILKKGVANVQYGDNVIMGGGIFFAEKKPNLETLVKKANNFIGWGIGMDPRMDLSKFSDKFSLLGTRERKSDLIDEERIFYVPCVSCMQDAFAPKAGRFGEDVEEESKFDVALHTNGGFNEKDVVRKFHKLEAYRTKTTSDFPKTIENLRQADCVVTNSYHGAYWGSLLGKKVVCLNTEVPKWGGLHDNVKFTTVDNVDEAISSAEAIPASYLDDCRHRNVDFFQRVKSALEHNSV